MSTEISRQLVQAADNIPPHPHDEITRLEVAIEKLGSEIALLNARRAALQQGEELQQVIEQMTRLRALQDSLTVGDTQAIAQIIARRLG